MMTIHRMVAGRFSAFLLSSTADHNNEKSTALSETYRTESNCPMPTSS
jgi:hypothetical protein